MNDQFLRDRSGKIVGKNEGEIMRDRSGKIAAKLSKDGWTRDGNGKIIGKGDQKQRGLC